MTKLNNEEFPLSIEELKSLKKILYPNISFLDIMNANANKVTECWHHDFTHKCACPMHGDGHERTPSFFFSENSKSYRCYSCSAYGDCFDFLSIVEGRPWFFLVEDFLSESHLTISQDEINASQGIIRTDLLHKTNKYLSIEVRDYLLELKGTSIYNEEREWTERLFKRMDDRFANLDDSKHESINRFKIQVTMDIERRRLQVRDKRIIE